MLKILGSLLFIAACGACGDNTRVDDDDTTPDVIVPTLPDSSDVGSNFEPPPDVTPDASVPPADAPADADDYLPPLSDEKLAACCKGLEASDGSVPIECGVPPEQCRFIFCPETQEHINVCAH